MIQHVFQRKEAYLLTVVSLLLGMFVIGFIDSLLPEGTSDAVQNLLLGIGEAVILLPLYLVLKQRRISFGRILPKRRVHPLTWVFSLGLTIGMLILIEWIDRILIPYFELPEFLQTLQDNLQWESLGEAMLLGLAGVVIASIVEEIIFRAVLQQSILHSYRSHVPGLIIPTVIFALFHVQYMFYLPAALEVVLLSFTLVYIVDRTGNIFLAMLSHAVFNLTAFISVAQTQVPTAELEAVPTGLVVLALVLVGGSIIYLQRLPDTLQDDVQVIEAPSLDEEG